MKQQIPKYHSVPTDNHCLPFTVFGRDVKVVKGHQQNGPRGVHRVVKRDADETADAVLGGAVTGFVKERGQTQDNVFVKHVTHHQRGSAVVRPPMHHRQPAQKTKLPDRHVRRAHGWRKEEERRRKKKKEEERRRSGECIRRSSTVYGTQWDTMEPQWNHNGTTMEPQWNHNEPQ